jgi:uncharacterized protein (TIGR02271 family)
MTDDPFQTNGDGVVRSEDQLRPGTVTEEAGRVRARKVVENHHVTQDVDRDVEHAQSERVPADADDSGEVVTLPDGSVSVPVFEEQLVIEKRLVVRERIIIRKHTVTEHQVVEADLRRERLEITADPQVADRVSVDTDIAD